MNRLLALILLVVFSVATRAAEVRGLPDFADLVEKYANTVVNISTTQVIRPKGDESRPPSLDEDDPRFDFFRRFGPYGHGQPGKGGAMPREFEHKSLGSGFVVSQDGYILTNAHVVDQADEILVRLNDKREFRAKVIGADKRTDVALIKIDAVGLPVVRLGDPGALRVGEWVLAIGSPFGFDSSVTAGIVSAKGRSLPQETYVPFIQTDVAINPGNSGGPLFNMKGEVVGINSQIYSRSGGYQGIAFAIPIDVAMDIQGQLKSNGRVSRGRIGVVIQEVTKELAESFGLTKAAGAIVNSVEPGGPAEKAGIEPGDVILKFDGKSVLSSKDLPRIVGTTRPGTRSEVQLWRKGALREVSLTVGEMQEDGQGGGKGARKAKPAEPQVNRLGLVLSEIGAEQKRELKVPGGILIEEVRGNAGRTELRTGDIILAMITRGVSTELRSIEQFNKLLAPLEKGSNITLLIRRGETQIFVTVKGVDGGH